MRLSLLSIMLSTACIAAELRVGDKFPQLTAEFLMGRAAILPDAAAGRTALLAFGFSYDSRFAVEAWVKKFRTGYGNNPRVTFYEIPVIGGMGKLGKWFIDGGMRRGTPKADQENVITVYGGAGLWKERLGVQTGDAAYLILLDSNGIVRWRHSCNFDDAAFKNLAGEVQVLLSVQ